MLIGGDTVAGSCPAHTCCTHILILILLLNEPDECLSTASKLLRGAALEEPVKPATTITTSPQVNSLEQERESVGGAGDMCS